MEPDSNRALTRARQYRKQALHSSSTEAWMQTDSSEVETESNAKLPIRESFDLRSNESAERFQHSLKQRVESVSRLEGMQMDKRPAQARKTSSPRDKR
jgi:hypothetical protein